MKRAITMAAACASLCVSPAAQAYTHPGIPLTSSDLAALKAKVDAGEQPWKAGYDALASDGRSSLGYTMQGPFASVSRNPNVNLNQWRNDMIAVYNLARMWYFTGNPDYAQKSRDILISWANMQTSFGGMEANLDLGDYAHRFVGGADILRGTWSGWTQADTDAVKNLFGSVYWTLGGDTLGPTNKGSLSLAAAAAIAAFNDDTTKMDDVLHLLRTNTSTGFSNTLSNGEHGETGRDQGHSYNHILATAFAAEILWKQGIDVYSERDNRLLAMGEYYARTNLAVNTPFVPMGTTDEYYLSMWEGPGYTAEPRAFNILKSHYVLRKGMSAPYMEKKLAAQPTNADAFMCLKPADDGTTATPPAPITWPSIAPVGTGLSNTDIGTPGAAGSGTYSNGTWTVQGAGTDIWTHGSESFHFTHMPVTGDCTIIAKVNSMENTHINAKAGVMIRSDLNAEPACKAWMAVTPSTKVEGYMDGWTEMYGGSNWEAQSYPVLQIPYWVKIERLNNVITCSASPDGTSWATIVVGKYANMPSTAHVGLCVTSMVNGTLNTATFTNVSITGGSGGLVNIPEAPLAAYASPGDGQAMLRWTESFGATSYRVKRSSSSGGPYHTVAIVSNGKASHIDKGLTNDNTYYYVVSAVNAAGEGNDSPQEIVTPIPAANNVAQGGTTWASEGGGSGTEGSDKAFDRNAGSKWLGGNNGVGWLQYDFGAGNEKVITRYDIVSANDVPQRDPKDWQFQGSNDGTNWTTLDTQASQTFPYRFFPKRYAFANTTAYRYHRLNITANNGGATYPIQLSELALMEAVASTPSGPRTQLSFDESGGTTASDATGNGWNGTLVNGPVFTTGTAGNAVNLDGSNDHVTLPSGIVGGLADFTASVWVKPDTVTNWSRVFDFGTGTSVNMFLTPQNGATGKVRFAITTNGGAGEQKIDGQSALVTGVWSHVVVTWSGNTGILYVNGVEVGRNSAMTLNPSSLGTTTQNYLGRSQYPDPYFDGLIDDFRIYTRALSATEIADQTAAQMPIPAAVTGLTATAGDTQVSLAWTAVPGVTGYAVKRSTTSGGPYATVAENVTATSFNDTGLTNGTTYHYVVSAKNAGGEGPYSSQASATPLPPAPAAPAGLAATVDSASRIALTWNASAGATTYNLKRATTTGGPYTTVATAIAATAFTDTGLSDSTSYYYVVSAVNLGGESANSTESGAITHPGSASLPSGWAGGDIGGVGIAGSAGYAGGTYTLTGSGADIWDTADQFQFVSRQITGDCDIIARVISLENTNPGAKAGVMIRESLNANSTHAMMVVTPTSGLAFQRRTSTGATSLHTSGGAFAAPHWVRLVRSGNTFTAYRSTDGAAWTTVGSETIAMTSGVYVGLAVTSHNNTALATATIDNVSIATLPSPWASADIGAVAAAGASYYSAGTFTIDGSGADIWDFADEFHYAYQTATGDCEIIARVTAVENTNSWAKAGIMIRESLNANSTHATMVVTPANGVSFQRRTSTGGASSHTTVTGVTAPHWVRLVRSGNTFTAYRSTDGAAWTTVGSQTISMASTVSIGIAVTSHNDGVLCTSTIDNVTVTP